MELAPELVDPIAVPRHVAIIMDGNGRWARAHGLPRIAGHRQGAEAVRSTVRACSDMGISYLTIYAFSSENWKRPATEVDDLMGLVRLYIRRELASLGREGVRIRFIGDRNRLDVEINRLIQKKTPKITGGYFSRWLLIMAGGRKFSKPRWRSRETSATAS